MEWYAEKIDAKDLNMDIAQDYSDSYVVQIAFFKHFNIDFEGKYIFMNNANNYYTYDYGIVRYYNAEDWLIIDNNDSGAAADLILSAIKLK